MVLRRGHRQQGRALRRDLLDAGDAHGVPDDRRIPGVLHAKDIAAAAPNLERLKRRLLGIHFDLFKHVRTIPRGESAASRRSLSRRGFLRAGFGPKSGDG